MKATAGLQLALAALVTFAFIPCCSCSRIATTIWRMVSASLDGACLAIAHTEQDGGFGSASIVTSVDLKRVDGTVNSGNPVDILHFDCPGPAAQKQMGTGLDKLLLDLRYSLRVLEKSKGFTAVAVLTLALAIGANVVVFGVLNAVLLHPLDVSNPESLY